MGTLKFTLSLCVFANLFPLAQADQGSFINSGGSAGAGSGVTIASSVASPAGALTINCPGTGTGTCAGGSLTFYSTDGTMALNAAFTAGTYAEACAGGGKGGHVTCGFSFTGSFRGTLAANGALQAITGVTSQGFASTGANVGGSTAYVSAYTPFYYSDSGQILRSDDLLGTNQIAYGTQGGGVGQFYGAYGLAVDAAGRIYVADTYNCRIVRIDDMTGTNWTSYGACGAGQDQFYDPSGIALDAAGRIYVMDTGNCRVVRVDDLNGTNWAAYGSQGSGAGQFAQWLTSLAVDSTDRVYVADTGNRRIVRMDDMAGTNWTALTTSVPVNGATYSLNSPMAVALDAAGRIYVADNEVYQPAVIRVDDITGANWTYLFTGSGNGLNTIAVDRSGAVFTGGGGAKIVVNMSAVLNSTSNLSPYGPYYVFGVTPVPLPTPRPSAISFTPSALSFTQNVGTAGRQTIAIANFGGSPLNLMGISAAGAFSQTNTCGGQLAPGASCNVTVMFAPSATGPATGQLIIADDSGNLGSVQAIALAGQGTAPAASVTPSSVTFQSQVLNTTSNARTVTLQNVGTGPMLPVSVTAPAPFSQTNTCAGGLAAGASCTVSVTFTPTALGAATATLTIMDDAGTQTVSLSGTGSSPVSLSTTSLSFGSVVVGSTSAARTVSLSNRGNTTLTFNSVAITTGFAVSSDTCLAGVAAGGTCTVAVTFTPAAPGNVSGTLTFTDSAATSPQTVSLSGSGTSPVTLSTTSLSFNTTVAGTTASARSVTLTNHQSVALSFTAIAATAPFAIASNTCGASIAAGASCTVGVTFSPASVATASGALTFMDDAPQSPQSVALSGSGSAPVTLSTSSISIGTVTVGATSSAKTVTVTNHLSTTLTFSSITVTAPFAIASNTCNAGIAGGASCTVGVTFTPTATGSATGTLTFTDSALTSPQMVSLSGSGR